MLLPLWLFALSIVLIVAAPAPRVLFCCGLFTGQHAGQCVVDDELNFYYVESSRSPTPQPLNRSDRVLLQSKQLPLLGREGGHYDPLSLSGALIFSSGLILALKIRRTILLKQIPISKHR